MSSQSRPLIPAILALIAVGAGCNRATPGNAEATTTPGAAEEDRARPGERAGEGGGTIAFGGGVPLYRDNTKVGALGVSGDTSCADHETAKRVRDAAGLDAPKGMGSDDIVYTRTDGPSVFAPPLCPNTWRNGKRIGDEPAASAY